MSSLLVKHLAAKGCKKITILNRSLPRAEALAEEFSEIEFDIHLMADLLPCVEQSDVIFAASSSEEILIDRSHAAAMMPVSEKVPPIPQADHKVDGCLTTFRSVVCDGFLTSQFRGTFQTASMNWKRIESSTSMI